MFFFSQFGDIESVEILPIDEAKNHTTRAFICFSDPHGAAFALVHLQGFQFLG